MWLSINQLADAAQGHRIRAHPVRERPGEPRALTDKCSADHQHRVSGDALLAEPDAFAALHRGGVALERESPAGVHVRGGASDQTAYLLDGIPGHFPATSSGAPRVT